ncbi:transcriptional regulator, TraR/DksA family protein [Zobellella endophytica]|uniref:Transcriptional regulator, TraR/DksA family protein n=1 Tax=Zobellella endophytica TaxID=2116700 RepID=A0A2P7RCT0_9GAMM|nr:transcriptional regulator, TraR/DksA family protein [Zobellella endophytica]PSJ47970.1 transcriptional regulator, TraR/DksA family protein [Zobellella endophytica]
MSSTISESQLEARLLAEARARRQAFWHSLLALDARLAAELHRLPPDEWADVAALAAYPQLHTHLKALRQVDAALCQWQLGLYGLCSDCEAELTPEQLWQDPCRQRCAPCEEKYRKAQHGAWEL